jgi:hypothetical protein
MKLDNIKFPLYVLLTGLALGVAADVLFYKHPPGLSMPIFFLLLIAALLSLAFVEKAKVVRSNLWLIAPIGILAVFTAILARNEIRFFNLALALILLVLLANRLIVAPFFEMSIGEYIEAGFGTLLFTPIMPFALIGRSAGQAKESGGQNHTLRQVLLGIVLAVPILLIFASLLSSADLIFSRLVADILKFFDFENLLGHILIITFAGWAAIGLLALGLSGINLFGKPAPADGVEEAAPGQDAMTFKPFLPIVTSGVVMFSVDVLFAVFVAIQAAAMFGGEAFVRSQGLTYSDYARRGFFELLAVSIIVLIVIVGLDFLTRREDGRAHSIFLSGTGIMIGLTVVMLVSAYLRMQLYEEAYGFTHLRLYPHVFMVWLAILLAAVLAMLATRRMRVFLSVCLIAAVGYLITLDVINPDLTIARQNIARTRNGEELDVRFLGSLSEDALVEVLPLFDTPEFKEELGPCLSLELARLDRWHEGAGWQGAHWSMGTAWQMLDARRDDLSQYNASDCSVYYGD